MKVRYTLDALAHISSIHAYIKDRNTLAASRIVARIREAAANLGDFPASGRTGLVPGTREWVVTGLPYILVYELRPENDELVILAVYHGAQLRPGQDTL